MLRTPQRIRQADSANVHVSTESGTFFYLGPSFERPERARAMDAPQNYDSLKQRLIESEPSLPKRLRQGARQRQPATTAVRLRQFGRRLAR
jgi:hypothetical protein